MGILAGGESVRNLWEQTPMEKVVDALIWLAKFAIFGSILAIPVAILIAIVHFTLKHW